MALCSTCATWSHVLVAKANVRLRHSTTIGSVKKTRQTFDPARYAHPTRPSHTRRIRDRRARRSKSSPNGLNRGGADTVATDGRSTPQTMVVTLFVRRDTKRPVSSRSRCVMGNRLRGGLIRGLTPPARLGGAAVLAGGRCCSR